MEIQNCVDPFISRVSYFLNKVKHTVNFYIISDHRPQTEIMIKSSHVYLDLNMYHVSSPVVKCKVNMT